MHHYWHKFNSSTHYDSLNPPKLGSSGMTSLAAVKGAAALEDPECVFPGQIPWPTLPGSDHGCKSSVDAAHGWLWLHMQWVTHRAGWATRGDPGGHSNCVTQVQRWEILLQSAECFQLPQECTEVHRQRQDIYFPVSQCFPVSVTKLGKIVWGWRAFIPWGRLQAGGQDGLGNAACSILSNRQGEGKRTVEPREVSDTGEHLDVPPCKAAMNPFSLDAAIWFNTLAHHPLVSGRRDGNRLTDIKICSQSLWFWGHQTVNPISFPNNGEQRPYPAPV